MTTLAGGVTQIRITPPVAGTGIAKYRVTATPKATPRGRRLLAVPTIVTVYTVTTQAILNLVPGIEYTFSVGSCGCNCWCMWMWKSSVGLLGVPGLAGADGLASLHLRVASRSWSELRLAQDRQLFFIS